jgi:hypothetical protein
MFDSEGIDMCYWGSVGKDNFYSWLGMDKTKRAKYVQHIEGGYGYGSKIILTVRKGDKIEKREFTTLSLFGGKNWRNIIARYLRELRRSVA